MIRKGMFTNEKLSGLNPDSFNYLILLGMRSNGKSTAVKNYVVKQAFEKGLRFVYLRRWQVDIKNKYVDSYFQSVDGFRIEEITNGKYTHIRCYKGLLYFAIRNERDKWENSPEPIGYIGSLSDSEHMKSLNYPLTKYIIFEEFMTDKMYLEHEVNVLENVVSTIFRLNVGTVFMVANTMSRINPYFREWELSRIDKQKKGTIDIYNHSSTKIAVYLCDKIDTTGMNMFKSQNGMILNGEWDTVRYPHLPFKYDKSKVVYVLVFEHFENRFLMEFIVTGEYYIWYVSRKTTPIQKGTRVVSNGEVGKILYTKNFSPLNNNERLIFSFLQQGRVCFSDDITGTEFNTSFKESTGLNIFE